MNATQLQIEKIVEWLGYFMTDDHVHEVRGLGVGSAKALSLCASARDILASQSVKWEMQGARGIYFTLNPLKEEKRFSDKAANKADVLHRYWLPVDADPIRPAGTNATDAERDEAWKVISLARGILKGAGLRGSILGDSGNGWHNPWSIDLPNDDASQALVKEILQGLHKRCSSDKAKIDTSCHDAPRIWKLYGTWVRKGPHSEERPHRRAWLHEGEPWDAEVAASNTAMLKRLLEIWKFWDEAHTERPSEDILERARRYIAKEPPAVSGERGHDRCFHVACILVKHFGLNAEEAFAAIQDWNRTCQPPWSAAELRHKIADAIKQPGPTGEKTNGTNGTADSNGHQQRNGQAGAAPKTEEAWEPPTPLNDLPEAPPFPLDLFPAHIIQLIQETAWATHSPDDYAALPVLGVASGAIGNTRRLAITRTHTQSACLFAAVVGPPGSGKSPALDIVRQPLDAEERRKHLDWCREVSRWKEEMRTAEEKTPRPIYKRQLLDDVTQEKMVQLLAENPRGLTMLRDELSALITEMNQYKESGKGSDRQNYLKIWNGASVTVDRKSNPDGIPIKVRHPFLTIIGGIQPDIVEWIRGDVRPGKPNPPDDGFLDRFLVAYPEPLPAVEETWREVSQATADQWDRIVHELLALTMHPDEDGEERPHLVRLTSCGKVEWQRFTRVHAEELNAPGFPRHLKGPWAKLRGYCGRLALVLHYLRKACNSVLPADVDGESVQGGARLVEYFKAHACRLHAHMGSDPRVAEARLILAYLDRKSEVRVFSRRDIYSDLRHSFRRPEDLEFPLRLLCEHRYIRPVPESEKITPGRKPAPKYYLNPLYRASQNTLNTQNS